MAQIIFSAVVGDMAGRVISLLAGQFKGQERTDAKLRRICHMLIRIHSATEEAKGRQITNPGTFEWLSELNDGLYQGRYLLETVGCREEQETTDEDDDEHADKVAAAQPFSLSLFNPAKRVRVAASSVRSLLSRHGVGVDERIGRVVKILETISGDLGEFLMLLQSCRPIRRHLATNIFVEGQMFGRHVEKERTINFLLQDGGAGELGVLPIVGDAGVGKTTLAQHVCDDERVRGRFPIIMFSSFSCTLVVARGEPTFVLESKHAVGDAQKFIESVRVLRKKRFLMVFEDVDARKRQMLEELLPILRRHGKHGSKIIVITSDRAVARSTGTAQPISLKAMPRPEYWFFFKAHAFAGRDVEEDPRMVAAGRAIARKLNGSFFGAKIVGAVLKARPDPRFWRRVLRSNIGGLSLLGDGMGYIADLAENLLPSYAGMSKLTVSKNPFPSQTELARLDGLCQAEAGRPGADCLAMPGDDIRFAKVLVCRSILPFQRLYYTAHCAGRGNDSLEKFVRAGGSGRLADVLPSRKGLARVGV